MTFDRSAAREALCRIRLRNPGDWCYLNATLTGLLWMLLNGPADATPAEEISLYALPAIEPLLRYWGEQPNQPCCAAEFLMRVLEWGQFPLLSHSWEQRWLHGDRVEIHEKGGEHCLLTFNCLAELDMASLHISDCLASWLHHLGMRTAFVSATPFKCLHIDRGYLVHNEALRIPEIHFEEVIQVPIFDGAQLHFSYRPYLAVAILAHFGDRHGGHYVVLLRREGQWIEKNDGRQLLDLYRVLSFSSLPRYFAALLLQPPLWCNCICI